MDDRPRFSDNACLRCTSCLCLPCAVVNTCVVQPLKLCCCTCANLCLAFPPLCCSWSVVPLVFIGVLALLFIQTTQVEAFAALSILWDSIAIPADLFSQLVQIMWDTFIMPVLLIYNTFQDIFVSIILILFRAFVGLFPSPFAGLPPVPVGSTTTSIQWVGHAFHAPHTARMYESLGTHAALAASLPAPSVLVGGKYFVLVPPALFDMIVGNLLDFISLIGELMIAVISALASAGAAFVGLLVEGFQYLLDVITSGAVVEFIQFIIDQSASQFIQIWDIVWGAFVSAVPLVAAIDQLKNLLLSISNLNLLQSVIGCVTNLPGCGAVVGLVTDITSSVVSDIANSLLPG